MSLRFRKQTWLEMPEYIQVTLHEPYWNAGQRYGWQGEGLGVSIEAVRYAFKVNKKLRIRVLKYGKWEISPHMALRRAKEYGSHFIARDGKELIIIPRTACTKIEKSKIQIVEEKDREIIRLKSIQQSLI